jgi:anti-sigma factor ChrR (cupin superfamily)
MSKHEEFEELAALAATGQLSAEEVERLAEHLEDCEVCRAASDDFSAILGEMPASERVTVDHDLVRQIDQGGFRERFLARARAEGRRFSEDAEKAPTKRTWSFPRLLPAYQGIAAGVLLAVVAGAVGYRAFHSAAKYPGRQNAAQQGTSGSVAMARKSDDLENRMLALQQASDASVKAAGVLRAENAELVARVGSLEKQLVASEAGKADLEQTLVHTSEMNAQLASQLDENTQILAETKSELDRAQSDRAALLTDMAAAKNQVADLSQQVRLEAVAVDEDTQELRAARQLAGFMGAPDLHIIDVHDADGNGRDRTSSGRVFYVEGQQMTFYAFGLDEKKLGDAKYAFQVWGSRLDEPSTAKNLGVLNNDDLHQKTWVLKVTDPRQLAGIDSVFVTLEPREGAGEKPRGRKILYAFLGGQANHP